MHYAHVHQMDDEDKSGISVPLNEPWATDEGHRLNLFIFWSGVIHHVEKYTELLNEKE